MGCEEDQDFYLRLKKKELQDLCKRHGLSPYMSKPNLVNSLHSYFKASGCTAVQWSKSLLKDCGENSHLACNNVKTLNSGNALKFNESDLDAQGMCRKICSCKNNVTSGSDVGNSNVPQTPSRTKGALAKDDMAARSFEFFASSEEGIKLMVDLNSISSDWSKALYSSVCCCQYSNKFPSLRDELELLANRSKQRKDLSPTDTNFGHETNKDLQGPSYLDKGECEPLVPEPCSVDTAMHVQEKEIEVIYVSSDSESSPANQETHSVESNANSSPQIISSNDSVFYSATDDPNNLDLLEHQQSEISQSYCDEAVQNNCTPGTTNLACKGSDRPTDIQVSEVVNEQKDASSSLRRSNRLRLADPPVSEECTPACTKKRLQSFCYGNLGDSISRVTNMSSGKEEAKERSKLSNEAETLGSLQSVEKTPTASEGGKVLKRTRQHLGSINPSYSLPNVKVLRSHKLLLGPRRSPRLAPDV